MTDPQRHDWARIIAEIKAGYLARTGKELSDHKLGLMVHLDATSITNLRRPESQPKHYPGELLLALRSEYSRNFPLSESDAPGT